MTGALARSRRAAALVLSTLVSSDCGSGPSRSSSQPNLVVVVIDTLRPDRLGFFGASESASPRIDALLRESVVFENAQSSSPWTAPSVATLLTSLAPPVHGVDALPVVHALPERIETLAEIVRAQGIATAAFTEGGFVRAEFGLAQGFDTFDVTPVPTEPSMRVAATVDRAIEWIDAHEEQRFFALVHTYGMHSPYRASDESVHALDPAFDAASELARARATVAAWNAGRALERDGVVAWLRARLRHANAEIGSLDAREDFAQRALELGVDLNRPSSVPEVVARARLLYDACVRQVDAQLGRLFEHLRTRSLLDRTVVALVSDHGEGLGDHGELEHGRVLRESVLRVLFALRLPDGVRARREPALVGLIDFVPTVLPLLSIERGSRVFQGRDLLMLGAEPSVEEPLLASARNVPSEQNTLVSLRSRDWRLEFDTRDGTARLFDPRAQPNAWLDQASTQPDVVRDLLAALTRELERCARVKHELALDAAAPALDPILRRDLSELGYAGDER